MAACPRICLCLLPRFEFKFEDISVELWLQAVRRFRPRAARGPDGFAKQDLLLMPHSMIREMLKVIHLIERDEVEGPDQWLEGLVIILAKLSWQEGVNAQWCIGHGVVYGPGKRSGKSQPSQAQQPTASSLVAKL